MKNLWLDRKKAREAAEQKKRVEERWKRLEFLSSAHFIIDEQQLPLHYRVEIRYNGQVIVPFTEARYMLKCDNQISINFPDAGKFPMQGYTWLSQHGWKGSPNQPMDVVIKVFGGKHHLKTEQLKLGLQGLRFGDVDYTSSDPLDMSMDFDILG